MEVKVCKNCRRLFKYLFGPELCQECSKLLVQEKLDQQEQKTFNNQETQPAHQTNTTLGDHNNQNPSLNKNIGSSIKSIVKDELAKFEQVRDYIMTHPRATVAEIAEVNDIPPTKLFEWIKNDRLEFSDDSQYAWFNCERCGAKIKSGRLCNRCKVK